MHAQFLFNSTTKILKLFWPDDLLAADEDLQQSQNILLKILVIMILQGK